MFKGRHGDIDGVFITSEGLLRALARIKGSFVTWRDWGLKAVVGPPSASSDRYSRKRRESEMDSSQKAQEERPPVKTHGKRFL